jgi:hydroxymethylglutaryl-CoA reductase
MINKKISKALEKVLEEIAEKFNASEVMITLTNKKTKKKKIWKLSKIN